MPSVIIWHRAYVTNGGWRTNVWCAVPTTLNGHPQKAAGSLAVYGSDACEIRKLIENDPALGHRLHADLPYVKAEVIWGVRNEMARTVEDILARRTRALFLNARAALDMAPTVADLMAPELGWDDLAQAKQLAAFRDVASNYILPPVLDRCCRNSRL